MENSDENDENVLKFKIDNVDISIVNALRRIMIAHIPSIVIENICIKENNSSFCDNIIVHRLGQIPLKKVSDTSTSIFEIKLEAVGPATIYSKDIIFPSSIKPVEDNIIILKLKEGEQIKLFGYTEEGYGYDHSKFSVCCGTSYKKISDNSVEFYIETTGVYNAKEVLYKSLNILKNELLAIKKLL